MSSGTDDDAGIAPVQDRAFFVEVRGGQVQVGEHNTQINYVYPGEDSQDGVPRPPWASVSGTIGSPYRGLEEFREQDAPFFFGREDAATEVLARMSRLPGRGGLLVVSGASGAGKSSLLQAGVLPRLRGAGLAAAPDAASWPCLLLAPGPAPLDELALGAAALTPKPAETIRRELRADPAGFALTAREAARAQPPEAGAQPGTTVTQGPSRARLVLIVDQFEQVFTRCRNDEDRRAFITALHAAARGPGGTPAALVILGVRADFETRCADYPELAKPVQDRYLVTPMTERQLRLAVTGPARQAGVQVDSELTTTLLDEVRARQSGRAGAGVLPLLSHALDQSWHRKTGPVLTLADYESTGGIEGAVAASAKRAYAGLTDSQQETARQIFTRLVAADPGGDDTSDRVTRAELADGKDPAGTADVEAVLEAFAAERLLTLTRDSVEISHEALLTAWPLLEDWLTETHDARIVRTRLRGTAAEWEKDSRDPSYLYRGTLLQAAAETAARADSDPARNPPLSPGERDFLRASQQASRRSTHRRQAAIAVLAVLVLIVGGLAAWANQQREVASQQRDQAIANQLVAESGQISSTNPSLSAQLLRIAYTMAPSQDIRERLIGTENQPLSAPGKVTSNSALNAVAFSPDGKTLATGDGNGTGVRGKVTLWNATSPTQLTKLAEPLTLSQGGSVNTVAFSPDGKTLATGDDNGNAGGEVTLWNVTRPTQPTKLAARGGSTVTSVAFSPDGKTLAVGDDGNGGEVTLWNVTRPTQPTKVTRPLTANDGYLVTSMAFSPDGNTLALGGGGLTSSGNVTLWNLTRPTQPTKLPTLTLSKDDMVTSVGFSPDGKTLAVGDGNGNNGGEVTLWNLTRPTQPTKLPTALTANDGGSVVNTVAFSRDGRTLAVGDGNGIAGGGGGEVTLWNVTRPTQPTKLPTPLINSDHGAVKAVAFSPDGKTLAVGDGKGTITRWTLPVTNLPASPDPAPALGTVAFSPNSRILAAVGIGGGGGDVVTLWNVTRPTQPTKIGRSLTSSDGSAVNSEAFSPDGKTLAVGDGGDASGRDTRGGEVTLWNVTSPTQPTKLAPPLIARDRPAVNEVAFSPDGKTLAAGGGGGGGGGEVTLWNVTRPTQPTKIGRPLTDQSAVMSVAFSPDGKTLAAGDNDSSGGGSGGEVTLWNVSRLSRPTKIGRPLSNSDGNFVSSVAFSPDGKTLAVGDGGDPSSGGSGEVRLWNVTRPTQPTRLAAPLTPSDNGLVESVAFSPDGKTLAAGDVSTSGGEVTLWNVVSPKQPVPFSQPLTAFSDNGAVNSIGFSPDGSTLAAAEPNNTMQIWETNVNYAIDRICQSANGVPTSQQWIQYIPQLPYQPACPNGR